MEKSRIVSKLARLTSQSGREVSNRDHALKCARDSMTGDPATINDAVVGNVVAAFAKAAKINATIERLQLEIQFLEQLVEDEK